MLGSAIPHRDEKMLSVEDFKAEMFKSFRDNGMLDLLRAQLRRACIEKLQKKKEDLSKDTNQYARSLPPLSTLHNRVVHGLVQEYFSIAQLEHSKAVFLPEIGGKENLIQRDVIEQMLEISVKDDLSTESEPKPLLFILLDNFLRKGRMATTTTCTQTTLDSSDHRFMLETQLRRLDHAYLEKVKADNTFPGRLAEGKMRQFEKGCENRYFSKLQNELELFKSHELERVREEELQRCQDEMEKLRESVLNEQEEMHKALCKKEQLLESEWEAKRRDMETQLFEMRQSIFDKMDQLRTRESSLESKYAGEDRRITVERDRLTTLEEKLRRKEETLDQVIHSAEQAKENKLLIEKATWVAEIEKREQKVLSVEAFLTKKKETLELEKKHLEAMHQETREQKERLESYEVKFCSLTAQLTQADTSLARLDQALAYKEELLQDFRSRYESEHQKISRLENENDVLLNENKNLRANLQAVEENKTKLHGDVARLREEMIGFRLEEANTLMKERKRMLEIAESQRRNSQRKEDDLLSRMHELRSQLSEAEATSDKYRAQYEDETAHVESLRQEVRNLNLSLSRANSLVHTKHGYGHSRITMPIHNLERKTRRNEHFQEAWGKKILSTEYPLMTGMGQFPLVSTIKKCSQTAGAEHRGSCLAHPQMSIGSAEETKTRAEEESTEDHSIVNHATLVTPLVTNEEKVSWDQLLQKRIELQHASLQIERHDGAIRRGIETADDRCECISSLPAREDIVRDGTYPRASLEMNNSDCMLADQNTIEDHKLSKNVRPAEPVHHIDLNRIEDAHGLWHSVQEDLDDVSKQDLGSSTERKNKSPLELDSSIYSTLQDIGILDATELPASRVGNNFGVSVDNVRGARVEEHLEDFKIEMTVLDLSTDQLDHPYKLDDSIPGELQDVATCFYDANKQSVEEVEINSKDVICQPGDENKKKSSLLSRTEESREDALLDMYRERVLARRAAEKENYQEAAKLNQAEPCEYRSDPKKFSQGDSDEEELEESSASFAMSR
ncbi:unnamed protein product [Albugo candida]|uniref:FGFR1 oncogene partner (FOP) N-terminal dimerisation domain-containing protein n=1 Tax=Albugo candida TaxID=65357 RepID=A0A024GIL6_9STRA|nr:unnamed protein product [Albugo candida]|eukprot:CCI46183.1 unnamed protein product [Albugo candida]